MLIAVYIVVILFLGFLVNHCGRKAVLSVSVPYLGRLTLYDNQHHDNRHTCRHGN